MIVPGTTLLHLKVISLKALSAAAKSNDHRDELSKEF